MTFGAKRFAAIACQHYAILYLVLILLHHLEEGVDALEVTGPFPQHPALFVRQLVVRGENGEAGFFRTAYHHVFPLAHLLASPAHHRTFVDGEGTVGDDQMLVNADDTSETLTLRTGSDRGVEGEHLVVGLFKRYAVRLEFGAETIQAGAAVRLVEA